MRALPLRSISCCQDFTNYCSTMLFSFTKRWPRHTFQQSVMVTFLTMLPFYHASKAIHWLLNWIFKSTIFASVHPFLYELFRDFSIWVISIVLLPFTHFHGHIYTAYPKLLQHFSTTCLMYSHALHRYVAAQPWDMPFLRTKIKENNTRVRSQISHRLHWSCWS